VARYVKGPMLMSELRRLDIKLTHTHATVRIERPVLLGPGFSLHIPDRGTLVIGPGCRFRRGFYCEISGDGRVEIGAGTSFTGEAMIQCSTSITIGTQCVFGQACFIADGNHRFKDPDVHWAQQGYDFRPITIGDGVLALTKVTIVHDVGERVVVAAHSVVTQPASAYSVVAGAPAVVKSYFGPDAERREEQRKVP
jgi:acetyltransferase-like isoleucine patch superfamily enzyme